MPNPSFIDEIPIPADSELLSEYLALGWCRLEDPPRLKWQAGKGMPSHPNKSKGPPVNELLQMLDGRWLDGFNRYLPKPQGCEKEFTDLRLALTVRFQKIERRQKRFKSAPMIASWKPIDAWLIPLSGDDDTG